MARDVDILEGAFIKDFLGGLENRLTRLNAQIDAILNERLEIP